MKGFESPVDLKPDTQLVAEIQKEYTLKLKLLKQPGLILFSVKFVPKGVTVERVKITTTLSIGLNGKPVKENRATYDENCLYIWAINEKNAARKAFRAYTELFKKELSKKNLSL